MRMKCRSEIPIDDPRSCSHLFCKVTRANLPPPAVVNLDGHGYFTATVLQNPSCPDTHFQCRTGEYYCLPVYVICNGVSDCPGREDEASCYSHSCPGYYRCRASSVCLHEDHLCDGIKQCPRWDDELFCKGVVVCPPNCTCYGLSAFCGSNRENLYVYRTGRFRFIDARGSGMNAGSVSVKDSMLVYLSLAECGLTHLDDLSLLKNLRILDLSDNRLTNISSSQTDVLQNLHVLNLAGNPLLSLSFLDTRYELLHTLDLSRMQMEEVDFVSLVQLPSLQNLNLSFSGHGTRWLPVGVSQPPSPLRILDIRSSSINSVPQHFLKHFDKLETIHATDYKICCPGNLPDNFNVRNCHAPTDEISSCEDLLRSNIYRVFLSVFSTLALIGNMSSFLYRNICTGTTGSVSFGIFVSNLCVADFLMGVFLVFVGVADRMYSGSYLWKDEQWKHSAACKVAGFLSLLSCEASAFIICLITLDRFLVLRFSFSHVHFGRRSARVACTLAWALGSGLAAVPLLPVTSHWAFYSQTGICIPLPVTRKQFPGREFSFAVMIVLNFVLFLLIAVGQLFIYLSVVSNSMAASDTTQKAKDLTIARRLITIAISDFLCWFPIGLAGLMASAGTPVPSEVNVALAIFVLPLNSALNPFLYTINMILERRRRAQEQRLRKFFLAKQPARDKDVAVK